MIDGILSPEHINDDFRLALVNAIYFQAEWSQQFEESFTEEEVFFPALDGGDKEIRIPTMHQSGEFAHMSGEHLSALQLPFKSGSFLIVLPKPGQFAKVVNEFNMEQLETILRSLAPAQVCLSLPRFNLESKFSLKETLSSLGLAVCFNDLEAEFPGMTTTGIEMVVSEVLHRARIKLDEHGVEAAAATAVLLALAGGIEPEPLMEIPFVVDRPFLFMVLEDQTDSILFAGRVIHPVAN